jgi:hypothetical protein
MTRLFPEGEPIEVQPGPDGQPVAFSWRGVWHRVSLVCNRWRVGGETWWTHAEASREYWKLATADGLLVQIYCNTTTGAWLLARVYD